MIQIWSKRTLLTYLLLPIAFIWKFVTTLRMKKEGKTFTPLIVCVGNITVGGAGKTPFTIFLATELKKMGITVAILSRGYKGKIKQKVLHVDHKKHNASLVGDEALILSKAAPLVIAKNRALGAQFLEKQKYKVILMDDGLQNNSLKKDVNILLFNTLNPFGNNFIIPAGPLRETLKSAKDRIDVVVGVGKKNKKLRNLIHNINLKYIEANISVKSDNINLQEKYLAFASIAYPDKFFHTLETYGAKVYIYKKFSDHYLYKDTDIENLINIAKLNNLKLITTSKDYVKINPKFYPFVKKLEIELDINKEDKSYLVKLIKQKLKDKNNSKNSSNY